MMPNIEIVDYIRTMAKHNSGLVNMAPAEEKEFFKGKAEGMELVAQFLEQEWNLPKVPAGEKIVIYSDGACSGNPGPGGYGTILMAGGYKKELNVGYAMTTNNRMELRGVIAGLAALRKPSKVDIFTDSKYVVDAIDKFWLDNWQKNNWRTADKKPVKNQDLWKTLCVYLNNHEVTFHWVKGHADNVWNQRCDELAVEARTGSNLILDEGYKE